MTVFDDDAAAADQGCALLALALTCPQGVKVLGLGHEACVLDVGFGNEGQVIGFWNLSLLTSLLPMMMMTMMMMLMLLTCTVWKSLALTWTMKLMSLTLALDNEGQVLGFKFLNLSFSDNLPAADDDYDDDDDDDVGYVYRRCIWWWSCALAASCRNCCVTMVRCPKRKPESSWNKLLVLYHTFTETVTSELWTLLQLNSTQLNSTQPNCQLSWVELS